MRGRIFGAFENVGELAEACGADCVKLFASCSNWATRFIMGSSCIGKKSDETGGAAVIDYVSPTVP